MSYVSNKIWSEFAELNHGTFSNPSAQVFHIHFKLDCGELFYETIKKPFSSSNKLNTRVSLKLNFTPSFEFKVRHQGIFNKLFVTLGMQDISIEDTYFDENFIIQGENEASITDLFKEEAIVNYLPKSYELKFELKNKVLTYHCRGFINEVSMLECLLTLMKNTSLHLKRLS